ncbi:secretion-regulating guanine nucleotide exchange factor-like [Acanthaster planci]|uniref:Secretion-regulating guanine nucleotide exchange factor-like n=1 Tax=Acanthaster planci TaxID=133434 RepID=A0A8B7YA63_ACAPL|nr:secretion-regulating guanine nucleotide exchange factor-like [Acanthaster planci]
MAASSRNLLAWGANSFGQLALGHTRDCLIPEVVDHPPEGIKLLAGGAGHTALLTESGKVFMCGSNFKGQLGLGHTQNMHRLVEVPELPCIAKVACGWDHTLAITDKGHLFSWGSNMFGQLAHTARRPARITAFPSGHAVIDIAAGLRHSLAVTKDGRVWSWGSGVKGQLGRFDQQAQAGAQAGAESRAVPEKSEQPQPVNFDGDKVKIIQVAAGANHSVALSDEGIIYVWGENKRGQLGEEPSSESVAKADTSPLPKALDREFFGGRSVQRIHSGWTHMIAVLDDRTIVAWGRNDYGQLGCPAKPDDGDDEEEADEGTSEGNGERSTNRYSCTPVEVPVLQGCRQIVCGAEHNLAITEDQVLLAWGWNEHGMCGDARVIDVHTPKKVDTRVGGKPVLIGSGAGHCLALCE